MNYFPNIKALTFLQKHYLNSVPACLLSFCLLVPLAKPLLCKFKFTKFFVAFNILLLLATHFQLLHSATHRILTENAFSYLNIVLLFI